MDGGRQGVDVGYSCGGQRKFATRAVTHLSVGGRNIVCVGISIVLVVLGIYVHCVVLATQIECCSWLRWGGASTLLACCSVE